MCSWRTAALLSGTQTSKTDEQNFKKLLSEYLYIYLLHMKNELNFFLNLTSLNLCRYLAPEHAENGICSVKTDVFAFGIILIQLISGHKGADSIKINSSHSLREWVRCSISCTISLPSLLDQVILRYVTVIKFTRSRLCH